MSVVPPGKTTKRGWPPVLTGVVSLTLTLGLALWCDVQRARSAVQPEREVPGSASLSFGEMGAFVDADLVFPFERYVVEGATQWSPLLLQLNDPEFLGDDKRACISLLATMPEDEHCRVEYSFALDPGEVGRVLAVQALVLAGEASPCRAYVECRLPGLASAMLDVPVSELLAHPAGLRITDKVTHATRRPTVEDEEREIASLTEVLASPAPPDLELLPPAQRLQRFLDQRQARQLEVLRQRKQRR